MPMVSFIKPYALDPFVGHLATPVTTSAFTRAYLRLLPAYRPNLTPLTRGTEIGFTHGYFLFGPFYSYGPLRPADILHSQAIVPFSAALLATIVLVVILTVALSMYGRVTHEIYEGALLVQILNRKAKTDKAKVFLDGQDELKTVVGWQKFAQGFLRGGVIGSITAAALVYTYAVNSSLLDSSLL
jgi:photosystem I subunit 11